MIACIIWSSSVHCICTVLVVKRITTLYLSADIPDGILEVTRVFWLLLYSVAVSDIVLEVEAQEPTARSLSILLTTGLYAGHLFPLVSLGEELVSNVTLCANVMKGSHLYPEVPERVGIRFWLRFNDPR